MNNTQYGAIAEAGNQEHMYRYAFEVDSARVLCVSKTTNSGIANFGVRLWATVSEKQVIVYPSTKAEGTTNYAVIDRELAAATMPEKIY